MCDVASFCDVWRERGRHLSTSPISLPEDTNVDHYDDDGDDDGDVDDDGHDALRFTCILTVTIITIALITMTTITIIIKSITVIKVAFFKSKPGGRLPVFWPPRKSRTSACSFPSPCLVRLPPAARLALLVAALSWWTQRSRGAEHGAAGCGQNSGRTTADCGLQVAPAWPGRQATADPVGGRGWL